MYRLLIVDDEPPIAEGLADMIEGADLPLREISYFFSARKALEDFRREPYEIVLADIRMPEMTGLNFVEEVRKLQSKAKVIFLTGFSDFNYARRAIELGASNYLLKPAEDEEVLENISNAIVKLDEEYEELLALEQARKQAREALPALQSELFRQMLNEDTHLMSLEWRVRKFKDHSVGLDASQPVQTLIVRVDDYGRRFDRGDMLLIQFAVQNMAQELLEKQFQLFPVSLEEQFFVFFIQAHSEPEDSEGIELMRNRLSDAQQMIDRLLGVSLSMALSPKAVDWERWPDMYRFLQCSLRLNANMNVLFTPHEGIQSKPIHYGQLNEVLNEVTDALQNRNQERFKASLQAAFDGDANGQSATMEEIVLRYLAIASSLSNLLILYNLSDRLDSITLDKLSNFSNHRDMEERKKFLLELFHFISDKMSRIRDNPSERLIDQVKQYIEEHLHEDLSLHILAKERFVSPSYLSRIFHQITGEQLTVYITRVKMQQAKQLLTDHRYRVQDVAEKLGYQSPNYFSKVFRKVIGISPQDFRSSSLS